MVAAHMMSGHFYWKNNLIFTLDWNLKRIAAMLKSHFQAQVSDFYEFFGKSGGLFSAVSGAFSHAEKRFLGITVEDEYPNLVVWKESHSAPVSSVRQNVAMTSMTAFNSKLS